jgi:PTS system nitrogen regulatory IIA component
MCDKISKIINENFILCNIKANNKEDIILKMAKLISSKTDLSVNKITKAIFAREQYGSTGVGGGVAIPHGRIKGIDNIILAVATTQIPIDYDSVDKEGVNLFFMLLVPENNNLVYLKLLSNISVLCSDKNFINKVFLAENEKELANIIKGTN